MSGRGSSSRARCCTPAPRPCACCTASTSLRSCRPLAHFYQAGAHFDIECGARRPCRRRSRKRLLALQERGGLSRECLFLRRRIGYASCMISFGCRPLSRRVLLASASIALLPRIGRAAGEEDFAAWLAGLRQDALAQGIAPATFDRAFAGVAPIARVLELDRRSPRRRSPSTNISTRVVTPQRRETGARATRREPRAARRGRPPLWRAAALHRRAVGHRDRFRPRHRRLSGDRRAGDPRL